MGFSVTVKTQQMRKSWKLGRLGTCRISMRCWTKIWETQGSWPICSVHPLKMKTTFWRQTISMSRKTSNSIRSRGSSLNSITRLWSERTSSRTSRTCNNRKSRIASSSRKVTTITFRWVSSKWSNLNSYWMSHLSFSRPTWSQSNNWTRSEISYPNLAKRSNKPSRPPMQAVQSTRILRLGQKASFSTLKARPVLPMVAPARK